MKMLLFCLFFTSLYSGEGLEKLCKAVWDEDIPVLQELIDTGLDINARDEQGYTPLYYAAYRSSLKATKILLDNGAKPDIRSIGAWPPLIQALKTESLSIADLLLEHGADLEIKDKEGLTPLLRAIIADDTKTTKFLLEKGANIEVEHTLFRTPIVLACQLEKLEISKLLLSYGAKLNNKDSLGAFPLQYVRSWKDKEFEKLLLSYGAKDGLNEAQFYKIPMAFEGSFFLEVAIEEKKHLLQIDTGSTSTFALKKKLLDLISKKNPQNHFGYKDAFGKIHKVSSYLIDSLDISGIEVDKARIIEDPSIKPHSGTIGLPFFQLHDFWLFDFPKNHLYAISAEDTYQIETSDILPLKDYHSIPMETKRNRVLLKVDTEIGEKTYLLDTGSKLSTIFSYEEENTQSLELFIDEDTSLGKVSFVLSSPSLLVEEGIDGVLGMDFLKTRSVFFDFKNRRVYFSPK